MAALRRPWKIVMQVAVIGLAGERRRAFVPDPEIDVAAAGARRDFVHCGCGTVPDDSRFAIGVVAGNYAANRSEGFFRHAFSPGSEHSTMRRVHKRKHGAAKQGKSANDLPQR